MTELPPERTAPKPPGVAQLTAEIDRTRRELEETVEAIVAKFDLPSRVRQAGADARQRVRRVFGGAAGPAGALGEQPRETAPRTAARLAVGLRRNVERNPVVWGAVAGALAALALGLVLRRRWEW